MRAFNIIVIVLLSAILILDIYSICNGPFGIAGGGGGSGGAASSNIEFKIYKPRTGTKPAVDTLHKIDSIYIKYNKTNAAAVWLHLDNGLQYVSTNVSISDAAAIFTIVNSGNAEFDTARLELHLHKSWHNHPSN